MRKQASLAIATEPRKGTGAELLTGPPGDNAPTVLALINKLALDPGADVEKLDRVMAMYESLRAKEAELQYNAAKGRILKKLPRSGADVCRFPSVAEERFRRSSVTEPSDASTRGNAWLRRTSRTTD